MKRIVILCDGTWNAATSPDPTNVVLLGRTLMPVDPDDVAQVPLYIPGVGTGRRGVTRMGRFADKFLGGTVGLGLMDNVVEAYTHLAFLHEPGDEVYVFGFSRGAFTARSLVGLIRSTGLLARSSLQRLPEVVNRYRSRAPDTHPRTEESLAFRLDVSPHLMTSERDRPAYEANAEARGLAPPEMLRLPFLGVWDTVGALGIPSRFGVSRLWNGRHAFHDTSLSSLVRSARHAVALDERRREFEPTLWTNLPELNADAEPDVAPYQERHFAGDHGAVGGGGPIRDISALALIWMMEGAEAKGLAFDPRLVAELEGQADPFGSLTALPEPRGGLAAALMRRLGRDRPGPATLDDVHVSARERWGFETDRSDWTPYRPVSLARLERDLQGWLDARVLEQSDRQVV